MKRTFENESSQLMVAKIGKTVGLDGKLKLHLMTDFPEQFKKGAAFESLGETLVVESYDISSSAIKFKNYNDVDSAAKLTNRVLYTTMESTRESCKLGKDEFFWFDIVGLDVVEDGETLGVVDSIERYGNTDYLVVNTDKNLVAKALPKSFLLPYQDRFILSVSIDERRIVAAHAKDILLAS